MAEFNSAAYPLPDGYFDFTSCHKYYVPERGVFLIPDPDAPFEDLDRVLYPRDFFEIYKDAMDGPEQYDTVEDYQRHYEALEQYNTRLVAWLESLGFDVHGADAHGSEIRHFAAIARLALRRYMMSRTN